MKIAQIAPLYESVPPKLYGGTERVVYHLTEALVDAGHDVTLYASGDSETRARLIPQGDCALRLNPETCDPIARHILMLEQALRDVNDYDVVHSHIDYLPYPFVRRSPAPVVTTLHGRLDIPDLHLLYREFDDVPVVSISNAQRSPLLFANWVGTVYHGLTVANFEFSDEPGDYLAFLGRISPEKRVDTAIEMAVAAEIPLRIAAKIDKVDWEYYQQKIKGLMNHPLVEYVGEIAEHEKNAFLGGALGLMFPIDWPEPFGLAMIEAMACGTPVIARRRGSVPEVVDHGVTGYIFENLQEGIQAIGCLPSFDRSVCRAVFERRFSARRMAEDYVNIFTRLIAGGMTERSIAGVYG